MFMNSRPADFWNGLDSYDETNRQAVILMLVAEVYLMLVCAVAGFLLGLGLAFSALPENRAN